MREDNYENTEEVNLLTHQIWKSMNILRGVLPAQQHHVYLFLLSAYYDGILSKQEIDFSNNLYNYVNHSIEGKEKYSEIIDVYAPIIKSVPEQKLNEILHHFSFFNTDLLENNFEEIFDNLLFKLAEAQGKVSGEFLLPYEISKFAMDVAQLPPDARVFNPFAGLASFATHLEGHQSYYGQEIVKSTWALGMLRLIRLGKNRYFNYHQEDSIRYWSQSYEYDLVISNPPFGLKIDPNLSPYYTGGSSMNAEQFVIKKGLESINYGGKVVCIASQGVLFRKGSGAKLREEYVEQGLLDTIISLPSGLLKHTGIPICILILTRKKSSTGKIRMVDASDFVVNNGRRDKRLDGERLLAYLKSFDNDEFVRSVSIEQVRSNDYNLSVQRYFADEFRGEKLKGYVKSLSGIRMEKGSTGKFVRTSNLSDDSIDFLLDLSALNKRELPTHSRRIEESCLLISTRWKTLKPTYFRYDGTPIHIGIEIMPFRIKEDLIDRHYLINELRSPEVLKQVKAYQNPGAIQFIKRADLLGIKIAVPSLIEQKAKIKGFQELSQKLRSLEKERNALAHGQEIKTFDEFASLKHSMGAPRQNILSNAKSLLRFFSENNTEAFTDVRNQYESRYNSDLLSTFEQIRDNINHISTILEKGEGGLILENYKKEIIPLKEFNQWLNSLDDKGLKFSITYDKMPSSEVTKRALKLQETLLKILLDNIISNTEKYAFKNKDKGNRLLIESKIVDDLLELEIKNNGVPFPKNFTQEKFTVKYSTANSEKGTGLGGYDIDRIATYFENPDWELILDENTIYPVIFKFSFPIIPFQTPNNESNEK